MVEVDEIKDIRYLYHVKGLSIREIKTKTGKSKTTIQKILKSN